MKTILVTGSKGFIGKNLVPALKELNYNVIEFSGDITKNESYYNLNQLEFSHCFHLAAKSYVPDSWLKPDEFIKTNVYGTEKILELCRIKNASLTFMSSYLYGIPKKLPIAENHPLQPNNPYAFSKHMAEDLCKFYSDFYNVKINILRPFNIYGLGQDERFLIPMLIEQTLNEKEIVVKDLIPKRDYVFILDVVEALILTLNSTQKFQALNIGSGSSLSVAEVIEEIKKVTGISKNVKSSNEIRINEIPDTVADISLAKNSLGWEPRIKFAEGLKKIIDYKKINK